MKEMSQILLLDHWFETFFRNIKPQTKLLESYWIDHSHITVLDVEIGIGCVILFEAGGEQSKKADNELVAMNMMDFSWVFSFCTEFLTDK